MERRLQACVFPILVLFVGIQASAQVREGKDLIFRESLAAFAGVEKGFPGKDRVLGLTGAGLAWGESYRLMAYVSLFEGTGDVLFLVKAMERMDWVLSVRDDKRRIRDEIRKRVMPAWCSKKYTKGRNYAWIVHAGMITYPMARLVFLVRRDPALRGKYGSKADLYAAAVEETVRAFNGDWREDRAKGEGWYFCDYLKRELPLNMQNSMGRTLTALWLASGEGAYRKKAEMLARYLKKRLRKKGGRYIWPYWPNDRRGVEDVSHGAINVDFAFCCFRAGILFTKEDMLRFAGTFRACCRPGKGFARRVDGKGDLGYSSAMAGWGHLGFLAPEVRKKIFRYFRKCWSSSILAVPCLVETGRPLEREAPPEKSSPVKKGSSHRR